MRFEAILTISRNCVTLMPVTDHTCTRNRRAPADTLLLAMPAAQKLIRQVLDKRAHSERGINCVKQKVRSRSVVVMQKKM